MIGFNCTKCVSSSRRVCGVSLSLCPLHGEHRGVNGRGAKIMAVFKPRHVLGPPSDQYCCAAAVRSVVDGVRPLSPSVSGSVPLLTSRTQYFSHSLSVDLFIFSPLLSPHTHTLRVNRFVLTHPPRVTFPLQDRMDTGYCLDHISTSRFHTFSTR